MAPQPPLVERGPLASALGVTTQNLSGLARTGTKMKNIAVSTRAPMNAPWAEVVSGQHRNITNLPTTNETKNTNNRSTRGYDSHFSSLINVIPGELGLHDNANFNNNARNVPTTHIFPDAFQSLTHFLSYQAQDSALKNEASASCVIMQEETTSFSSYTEPTRSNQLGHGSYSETRVSNPQKGGYSRDDFDNGQDTSSQPLRYNRPTGSAGNTPQKVAKTAGMHNRNRLRDPADRWTDSVQTQHHSHMPYSPVLAQVPTLHQLTPIRNDSTFDSYQSEHRNEAISYSKTKNDYTTPYNERNENRTGLRQKAMMDLQSNSAMNQRNMDSNFSQPSRGKSHQRKQQEHNSHVYDNRPNMSRTSKDQSYPWMGPFGNNISDMNQSFPNSSQKTLPSDMHSTGGISTEHSANAKGNKSNFFETWIPQDLRESISHIKDSEKKEASGWGSKRRHGGQGHSKDRRFIRELTPDNLLSRNSEHSYEPDSLPATKFVSTNEDDVTHLKQNDKCFYTQKFTAHNRMLGYNLPSSQLSVHEGNGLKEEDHALNSSGQFDLSQEGQVPVNGRNRNSSSRWRAQPRRMLNARAKTQRGSQNQGTDPLGRKRSSHLKQVSPSDHKSTDSMQTKTHQSDQFDQYQTLLRTKPSTLAPHSIVASNKSLVLPDKADQNNRSPNVARSDINSEGRKNFQRYSQQRLLGALRPNSNTHGHRPKDASRTGSPLRSVETSSVSSQRQAVQNLRTLREIDDHSEKNIGIESGDIREIRKHVPSSAQSTHPELTLYNMGPGAQMRPSPSVTQAQCMNPKTEAMQTGDSLMSLLPQSDFGHQQQPVCSNQNGLICYPQQPVSNSPDHYSPYAVHNKQIESMPQDVSPEQIELSSRAGDKKAGNFPEAGTQLSEAYDKGPRGHGITRSQNFPQARSEYRRATGTYDEKKKTNQHVKRDFQQTRVTLHEEKFERSNRDDTKMSPNPETLGTQRQAQSQQHMQQSGLQNKANDERTQNVPRRNARGKRANVEDSIFKNTQPNRQNNKSQYAHGNSGAPKHEIMKPEKESMNLRLSPPNPRKNNDLSRTRNDQDQTRIDSRDKNSTHKDSAGVKNYELSADDMQNFGEDQNDMSGAGQKKMGSTDVIAKTSSRRGKNGPSLRSNPAVHATNTICKHFLMNRCTHPFCQFLHSEEKAQPEGKSNQRSAETIRNDSNQSLELSSRMQNSAKNTRRAEWRTVERPISSKPDQSQQSNDVPKTSPLKRQDRPERQIKIDSSVAVRANETSKSQVSLKDAEPKMEDSNSILHHNDPPLHGQSQRRRRGRNSTYQSQSQNDRQKKVDQETLVFRDGQNTNARYQTRDCIETIQPVSDASVGITNAFKAASAMADPKKSDNQFEESSRGRPSNSISPTSPQLMGQKGGKRLQRQYETRSVPFNSSVKTPMSEIRIDTADSSCLEKAERTSQNSSDRLSNNQGQGFERNRRMSRKSRWSRSNKQGPQNVHKSKDDNGRSQIPKSNKIQHLVLDDSTENARSNRKTDDQETQVNRESKNEVDSIDTQVYKRGKRQKKPRQGGRHQERNPRLSDCHQEQQNISAANQDRAAQARHFKSTIHQALQQQSPDNSDLSKKHPHSQVFPTPAASKDFTLAPAKNSQIKTENFAASQEMLSQEKAQIFDRGQRRNTGRGRGNHNGTYSGQRGNRRNKGISSSHINVSGAESIEAHQ